MYCLSEPAQRQNTSNVRESRCALLSFLIRSFVCPAVYGWGSLVRPLVPHVFILRRPVPSIRTTPPFSVLPASAFRNTITSLFSSQVTIDTQPSADIVQLNWPLRELVEHLYVSFLQLKGIPCLNNYHRWRYYDRDRDVRGSIHPPLYSNTQLVPSLGTFFILFFHSSFSRLVPCLVASYRLEDTDPAIGARGSSQ